VTDLEVRPDPPGATFAARGHPVRWAWLGFVAVAALASLAIWTGGVGPAVDLRSDRSSVVEDRGAQTTQFALVLGNARRLPIEVTAVHAGAPGLEVIAVDVGRGERPFAPFELAHGEERSVVFTLRVVDCAAITMHAPRPWVRVRSPLGIERTEHLEDDRPAPMHEGPDDFFDASGHGWAWELSRATCAP
jgi:hypothetical protein